MLVALLLTVTLSPTATGQISLLHLSLAVLGRKHQSSYGFRLSLVPAEALIPSEVHTPIFTLPIGQDKIFPLYFGR